MRVKPIVLVLLLLASGARHSLAAPLPEALPEKPFSSDAWSEPTYRASVKEPPLHSLEELPTWKHFSKILPSKEGAALLLANRFVVDPGRGYREFFELYEENRYHPILLDYRESPEGDVYYRTFVQGIPSVVTPDVVLHNLHLYFGYAIATAEERRFQPELRALLDGMLKEAVALRKEAKGSGLEEAAQDAVVFLAVGRGLLDSGRPVVLEDPYAAEEEEPDAPEPPPAAPTAEELGRLVPALVDAEARALAVKELERVLAASAKEKPGILDYPDPHKEDYTQYTVRGHYVKTPVLQGYFRSMMWLGRIAFSVRSDRAIAAAGILTLAAGRSAGAFESWAAIDEACGFLFGVPDDPGFRQWLPPFTKAFGRSPRVADLADRARSAALREALASLEAPRIQGVVTLEVSGPELETTRAFHFFPQRRTVDALVFQGLVDPKVPGRTMVSPLEVPEVLGSAVAAEILRPRALASDEAYARQHARLVAELPAMLSARREVEAYSAWMDALRRLWTPLGAGRPAFMQSGAYGRLRLNASMASYAELKHDTVLYTKQSAAEMGGPGYEDTEVTIDDRGYVVPEVETYARVGRLLALLRRGLSERRLFPEEVSASYGRLEALVASLVTISIKELEGRPLDQKELDLVKFIGGDLEHFWHDTLIGETPTEEWMASYLLEQNNAQIVADVFTSFASVLHVATGYVHPVLVIFERDGKLHIGRGGVASYHELEHEQRLTDAAWREMLGSADPAPAPPEWSRSYMAPLPAEGCQLYFGAE